MKQWFINYFGITKKEWNGMVVMVVLIALILVAPYFMHYFKREPVINLTEFNKALAQLKQGNSGNDNGYPDDDSRTANPVLFKFDPNHLPVAQWAKLGLSGKQIDVLQNYQAKGGRFYVKTDLQKIYAITPDDYKRLEPYINLPDKPIAKKTDSIVEINSADSAKLTEVKGIGPAFAARIIKYRSQLGGFYKSRQLMEIYGIDSAKYIEIAPRIKVNPTRIVKIHINAVTIDQLRPFPYFNFKQMNAIIQYRKQHGNYYSMDDLRQVAILDDEILRKIAPYLSFK